MSNIVDRIRELPRALQLLGLVVVAIVGFVFWNDFIRAQSISWADESVKIEQNVAKLQESSKIGRQLEHIDEELKSIGRIDVPGKYESSHNQLNAAVNELIKPYRLSDLAWNSQPTGNLPGKNILNEITKANQRVKIITGDLSFEATPEDTTALIADLESHEAIERIKSVRMTKQSGGKLKVRLLLESWFIAETG